jgi:hypothetical protein
MADCQSLRDICKGLQGIRGGRNHLGIQKAPSRNALSHQNAKRDAMVFRDIYRLLHKRLGPADLHMSIPGGYQGITHHVA